MFDPQRPLGRGFHASLYDDGNVSTELPTPVRSAPPSCFPSIREECGLACGTSRAGSPGARFAVDRAEVVAGVASPLPPGRLGRHRQHRPGVVRVVERDLEVGARYSFRLIGAKRRSVRRDQWSLYRRFGAPASVRIPRIRSTRLTRSRDTGCRRTAGRTKCARVRLIVYDGQWSARAHAGWMPHDPRDTLSRREWDGREQPGRIGGFRDSTSVEWSRRSSRIPEKCCC